MTNKTIAEHIGHETLDVVRSVLVRATQELEHYMREYDEAETPRDKARVLNWTVNYMASNILGNARLDMLADAIGRLMLENGERKHDDAN